MGIVPGGVGVKARARPGLLFQAYQTGSFRKLSLPFPAVREVTIETTGSCRRDWPMSGILFLPFLVDLDIAFLDLFGLEEGDEIGSREDWVREMKGGTSSSSEEQRSIGSAF